MNKYLLAITLLVAGNSYATTINTNLQTSAQLQSACTISMQDINIGTVAYTYDSVNLGGLEYTCNKGVTGVISINEGNSGVQGERHMVTEQLGSDHLKYSLSLPAKTHMPLGDGTNGTYTIPFTSSGESTYQFISAVVLRGQYITEGQYSDTLAMTLTY